MDHKTLIEQLSKRTGIDKGDAASILDTFVGIVADRCSGMDTPAISGFGMFEPKLRQERINRHPASGKRMLLPPKITLTFKPSALLKQKIRGLEADTER